MTSHMTSADIRAIAEEAFIYAYPIVHGYRALHWLGVRKGGFNKLMHYRRIIEPEDDLNLEVQINLDTLYTQIPMDLRDEPLVMTIPDVPDRYFSVQFSDFYMHNFRYLGTRTTGQQGGRYLIADQRWQGTVPPGIDDTVISETPITYCLLRILVRGKEDEAEVNALQDRFKLEPLSQFLGEPAPPPAPDPEWMWPSKEMLQGFPTFSYFNYLTRFIHPRDDERELFEKFALIGVGPGCTFDPDAFGIEVRHDLEKGVEAAHERIRVNARSPGKLVNGWYVVPRIRGNRDLLSGTPGKRFTRAVQAMFGIYGVDLEECVYLPAEHDGNGDVIDGAKGNYVITLDAEMPAKGFWSITAYAADTQFLVPNELGRYALGDRSDLIVDPDGKIRIHLQHEAPPVDRQANWLPVPAEPLLIVLRMYYPEQDVIDARWLPDPIVRV